MVRPSRFNNPPSNPAPHPPSASPNPVGGAPAPQTDAPAPVEPPAGVPAQPPVAPPPAVQQVTGPTSALTSFLKEQGIRPRNVNRFTSIQPQASSSAAVIEEKPEAESVIEEELNSEVDSDNLDVEPPVKRDARKKAGGAPVTASSSTKLAARKKSSSPGPAPKPKPGKYADRKPGFIATCAECGKRFTVTRYTPHAPGQGQLCDACAQEGIASKAGQKDSAQPASKKRKTRKNQVVKPVWTENSIQTLQMACIAVIARNIESIDALGNVGSVNLEKICQIVCKHRELKPVNLPLFMSISHSELKLFDCINLRQDSLLSIPTFCPRLERLMLNLCGHMTGEALLAYGQRLTRLRELDLFGPYLIRKEAWLELFRIWNTPRLLRVPPPNAGEDVLMSDEGGWEEVEVLQGPQITLFRLKQSPRFDLDCVKALVESCKNLTSLRLDDIGLLDDAALDAITAAGLSQLRKLAIANAGITNGATGECLTDQAVVRLLGSVGATLEEIDISQNKKLTDNVLCEGIGAHCRKLHSLNINGLREVTTKGVEQLFKTLKQVDARGLRRLNLARCIQVGNEGLFAILEHSGATLKNLDLNSVDELRAESLERLAKEAALVEELDVSFVRDVDDFIIKGFLDGMRFLKNIYVYGDNRVSDLCPTRKGVMIKGQERAIVVG